MSERKIFRRLVSVEEAQDIIRENLDLSLEVEEVPLEEAVGRVLAEDVVSRVDNPPFDRALRDGYAVVAEDTYGAAEEEPVSLRVIGSASAGHPFSGCLNRGEAVEISTGAPIPKGANAVVLEEHTIRKGDSVLIMRGVGPGENIQGAGTDVRSGEVLVRRGTPLGPLEIGLLAASGRRTFKVYRRPRVALFSSGDELCSPGSPLDFGKIYDINGFTLMSSLQRDGAECKFLGILPDREDEILRRLEKALQEFDLVILSGSTSVGKGDVMYRVLEKLGPPGVLIHGIAIKPGKPTVVGKCGRKMVFALPGFPTSCLTVYNLLVSPIIREITGQRESRTSITGVIRRTIRKEIGRRCFLPVSVTLDEKGEYLIFPSPTGSEAISTLSNSDGFVEIPEDVMFLEEGRRVEVILFGRVEDLADVTFIGSHCLGLEEILTMLIRRGHKVKSVFVGSLGGFEAISRGEADISGVHALDESGEYNLPFFRKYKLEEKALLIRGYKRRQGIIVQRGNPKGIRSFEDFLRDDVRIINRNRGSGTRLLVDKMLRSLSEKKGEPFEDLVSKIKGYHCEARTHNGVASAVKNGIADVGIGVEVVARMYGLDFIPIAEERYDFLVRRDRLSKRGVSEFLELLRSDEAKAAVSRLPGIEPEEDMGEVIAP